MERRLQIRGAILAAVLAASAGGAIAAQRVFVKSTGSDANTATGCLFANPCRSFSAALTQVDPGGEIVALDAAGYGAVTITKSVTLTTNPGFYAGISAATGDAVTIATADVNVVLRGLQLNGTGAANGVNMTGGATLTMENCVVSNFTNAGVRVEGEARVRITDTVLRGNTGPNADGVYLARGAIGMLNNVRASGNSRGGVAVIDDGETYTAVTVTDSDLSGNGIGVGASSSTLGGTARATVSRSVLANNLLAGAAASNDGGAGAQLGISGSSLSGNGIGILNSGSALVESQGDNFVHRNGTPAVGAISDVGGQ